MKEGYQVKEVVELSRSKKIICYESLGEPVEIYTILHCTIMPYRNDVKLFVTPIKAVAKSVSNGRNTFMTFGIDTNQDIDIEVGDVIIISETEDEDESNKIYYKKASSN